MYATMLGGGKEFLLYQSTPSEMKASVDHW